MNIHAVVLPGNPPVIQLTVADQGYDLGVSEARMLARETLRYQGSGLSSVVIGGKPLVYGKEMAFVIGHTLEGVLGG